MEAHVDAPSPLAGEGDGSRNSLKPISRPQPIDSSVPAAHMPNMNEPVPLRLIALDPDDLTVMSAHVQDAVVKVGDLTWLPAEKRFVLMMRRFDWEGATEGHNRRRLTAMHFERVTALKALGIDPKAKDAVLNLLAMTWTEFDAPAGELMLTFSGGAALKLQAECLEAQLKDLGGMWETAHQPSHNL